MVMVGSEFDWGNILVYVTGYLRDRGSDVTTYDLYIVLPFIVFASTLVFPFGMYFSNSYGAKL